MHVVIVHTKIDMAQIKEAIAGIDKVKQRLTALPGFEGGYWFDPIDGGGISMSLWETEANAQAGAPPPGFSPAPGVIVERVEIRAVIDQA